MRILFIVMRFGKDGLATNILELTRGLSLIGHEMHIITGGYAKEHAADASFFNELKSEFKDLGVQMHYVARPLGGILKKGLQTSKMLVQVATAIKKIDADVIHCHSPNLTFIPWYMKKKYISTVHADTIKPNFRYEHPDLLIAVSQGSQEFTERVMHSPKESIRMVYHGVSERFAVPESSETLQQLKVANAIPLDKVIIGVVGRITPQKGTDILLNAIGKFLSKELVDQLHIVIVGDYQNKDQEAWLTGLLEENGLEKSITVLPFRDPKPYYQIFDVFVLPSRSDTFGLVAVEAMMSGCCTIRSDSNGAYDQILHEKDGMIFPMEDAQELANQLTKVLKDDSLRSQLGIEGKKKALENFTQKVMIDKTLAVYEELRAL